MRLAAHSPLVRVAQWIFAIAVLWFLGATLVRQWDNVRASAAALKPSWPLVALSAAMVLGAYGVLVQTWRLMLAEWSAALPFWSAARVWCVSNLGRYVPGKVWAIATMGVMTQRLGVPSLAAVGSSVVVNLVSTVVGFLVVAVTGARVLDMAGDGGRAVTLVIGCLAVGILTLPYLLPLVGRSAEAVLGRPVSVPRVPPRAISLAVVGTGAAWLLYGVAFQLFCVALLGRPTGAPSAYIAVFTGSYLLGFIALFAPGGLGVRELAMQAALARLGLATDAEAVLLAVTSRLWLTVLEVGPGIAFAARDALRRSTPLTPSDGTT